MQDAAAPGLHEPDGGGYGNHDQQGEGVGHLAPQRHDLPFRLQIIAVQVVDIVDQIEHGHAFRGKNARNKPLGRQAEIAREAQTIADNVHTMLFDLGDGPQVWTATVDVVNGLLDHPAVRSLSFVGRSIGVLSSRYL